MELQNTVKEALNALYHHPDDAVRMQADRWLQDFQRTIDAWQVADNLLHDTSSNIETSIFCSQTLRSKVQRDFEELPSEAFRPLRISLNTLLKSFHKGPPKVRTQISLAVAALAVHVPAEDWGDGGILNWIRDEMNSHPECIPSFLELLRVLPEEVFNYKIAVRPDRRRSFENELAAGMEIALNVLTACLNINGLSEQVLEAFASWLRLRHRIPASALATHPLVLTALSGLNSDMLFEASVNVISELIHYTAVRNLDGVAAQMPLIQVLVPRIMNLKPQLRDPSKDEEDVKAVARLFADIGDAYVELIATGSDESMVIVQALVEVTSHPEFDIASMTFNFWHSLQMILTERTNHHPNGDKPSVEAEKSPQLLAFQSSYEALVSLVSVKVEYPQDYADLSREDQKDFKQTRYVFPSGSSFLSTLINILVSGMSVSEDTAAAAAVAFRHICDDCKKKLCGSLDGLFQIYLGAMIGGGPFKVSAEDSLHLVEALSMVVTELPSEHAKKALEKLCLPAVAPLQDMINQGPLVLGQKPARDLTVHINRLANIFRHANHPEAVADAVQRLWPIFKSIFDRRSWDMRTMESLCRACKNAVRTSKTLMGVTVGVMLEEIQALYKIHQQPCFLYLSSEVIKIFGSDPSCTNYLKILIESLFNHTTFLLTKIQDFSSRPDLVDDCFLLASRCIRYCPQLFFPSPVFPCLVDCSMIGITVQHREASNSILNFLSDVFDLANSTHGKPYVSIRDNVIIPRGAVITRILVAALTGALPSSRLETVTYTLLAITRAYGLKTVEWAKETLSLIPPNAVTEVERSRFLQALLDATSGAAINSLMVPIEELSDVCRRNRSVQE
ncbi:transportin MOS14-like [Salvia hispanica]|uniref:transportin MOS14-like n=1 Tax=Salvia hispanica TaxID=49212 RepID=UPI002008F52B|nr:transportin MOS14-like [Salvia hispanica]